MKLETAKNITYKISGYRLSLLASETTAWANRPGAVWPCSALAGHSIEVAVDEGGVFDYTGPETESNELEAIVSDYLPETHKHLWPCWKA